MVDFKELEQRWLSKQPHGHRPVVATEDWPAGAELKGWPAGELSRLTNAELESMGLRPDSLSVEPPTQRTVEPPEATRARELLVIERRYLLLRERIRTLVTQYENNNMHTAAAWLRELIER